ncbi:MAG: cysteine desulfurase, partial [Candidatus Cloacimonetes bacterium]|nr:cysteine desulfurase [Candidatus Cloacimonadota bacterium]
VEACKRRSAEESAETQKKPHIIVSPIEHHCVLDTAKHLEKLGVEVSFLPVDKYGLVNPADVAAAIKENTVLVSVMYVNNEVGTVEPIAEISKTISNQQSTINNKIYFHTDAVQAIQYLPCDVQKLGVDFLSLSAHKFHGPKGVGALYVREGAPLVRQMDGGGQEKGRRAGTHNVAGIVGLGEGIVQSSKFKVQSSKNLRDLLINGALKIPGVQLTGHPEKRAPHIASFFVEGVEGEAMVLLLNEDGIAASSGSACTSEVLEPSHVLTAMGIPPELSHGSLRLSLSKYTTEEEIDYTLKVLPKVIEHLRKMAPK